MRSSKLALYLLSALVVPCAAHAEPSAIFEQFKIQAHEASKLYASDAVLLAFRPGYSDAQKHAILRQYALTSDPNCRSPYFVRALLSPFELAKGVDVAAKINRIQNERAFRYVEPDFVAMPDQVATDPNFGSQYALNNTGQSGGTVDADIDAVEGWPLVSDALPPVVVAILDDGVDAAHQDLAANIWVNPGEIAGDGIDNDGNGFVDDDKGWDFSNNDRNVIPSAGNTHGTHCAGIVGMVRNNGFGGAGGAKNVRVMPLQIAGGTVSFYSAIANAVDYASLNGAKVMSLSYTIDGYSQTFSDAVGRAATRDVVYINSAGNTGINVDDLRGILQKTYSNVMFVANTNNLDKVVSSSNHGQTVQIGAPGTSIYSTYPNNTYATISGTSMSAPLVAAIVGQIRQVFPALTAVQAVRRAHLSADRIPAFGDGIYGGRANLFNALESESLAPSAPGAHEVVSRSHSAIKIRFNASGDNGLTGAAASYDIRVSPNPITLANFSAAEKIVNNLGGVTGGTPITTQITGLVPGRTYYVAIQALDNVGNGSPLSTLGPVRMIAPTWIDDTEGPSRWTPSGTWALTGLQEWSGASSWTDSPAGNYSANTNSSLTLSNAVVLPSEPILRFRALHALEWSYDFLSVELTTDNGATWTRVGSFSGGNGVWETLTCSLSPWAGQSVKLRFRVSSDGSTNQDGVYIDDISIVPGTRGFFDNVEGANNFSGSGYTRTTLQSFSPSNSWTDSAGGNSTANSTKWLQGVANINGTGIGDPELSFMARTAYRVSDRFSAGYSVDNGGSWMQSNYWPGSLASWSIYSGVMPNDVPFRPGIRYATGSGTTLDGVFLDDFAVFGEPFWSTLNGSLTRAGFIGTPSVRPATVELLVPGGGSLGIFPLNLASVPTGNYFVDLPQNSTVNLVYRAPGFITRRLNGVVLNWNTILAPVTLPNGDADLSGDVDAADIDLVISKFGLTTGAPGYTDVTDVDGSGEVDAADIDLAIANFGATND